MERDWVPMTFLSQLVLGFCAIWNWESCLVWEKGELFVQGWHLFFSSSLTSSHWQASVPHWLLQEILVLCHMGVSISCLSVLMTWQLASSRVSDSRKSKESYNVFQDLVLVVTLRHFHTMLLVHRSALFLVGGDYQGTGIPKGRISGGLLEAGCHAFLISSCGRIEGTQTTFTTANRN